ncbi:hypothetical protein [Pseudolabrys sp. FHR47]|uniref:hypothetical protein n=1 Tax=Pseudolabrys sp. FHR47 TaxID=2562284 RepID=UPI00351AACD2
MRRAFFVGAARPTTTATRPPASAATSRGDQPNRHDILTGAGGGCTPADLRSTGGDGLLYCFAAN